MRRYGKWALTLGLMAATPGAAMADGFLSSIFKPKEQQTARQEPGAKTENQRVAEDIAAALRTARLTGYDIEIEYKDGVARLTGRVRDANQRARATKLAESVQGVEIVDNRMTLIDSPAAPTTPAERPIVQASASPAAGQPQAAAEPTDNQQTAEQIARALGSAGLSGFDIEVRYKNGQARLDGVVGSLQQRALATQVVSTIPAVKSVENRLKPLAPQAAHGVVPAGYQPAPHAQPGVMPTAYQPQGMPAAGGAMPTPMPVGYSHGGPGGGHAIFDTPHVPQHAWPTYAAYPNYAQVTYPSQYSASAWPYIGPYYPYPQVPLGWRAAQLEWDDGYWALNFKPRTERWWWFMNPKNW